MRLFRWIKDNILFFLTLFLLAFIPLYPKLPILDVVNTWVYIRAEDFVVVFALLVWLTLFIKKKITLKTPLTLPIILFWIIGAIATIHGVILIFPTLAGVHSNVAFLSFLRRIEYISVFFIAYSAMKEKRQITYIVAILAVTLLCVALYGFGQKYFGFNAYLTMNEEFAKGTPIQLSSLSRVPSTFGGHYDLAAYLVLIIPLLTSMIFGFKNWIVRLLLFGVIALGFALLFMTVSRVSFFVLLMSLFIVIIFQKKKLAILALSLMVFASLAVLSISSSLLQRFGNTVKEVQVIVNAKTGEVIGHAQEVKASYFENKIIRIKYAQNKNQIDAMEDAEASASAIIHYTQLPSTVPLVVEANAPNGESLPQGTGYINLPLSPIIKKTGQFLYEKADDRQATSAAEVYSVHGDFLIKKATAYDLSFTTRFQGEWPNAIEAFKRNILLGSGYASISLAVDNNYLRILGEVGLLGFASFFGIFLVSGIYIKKVLPEVDSPIVKSFVLGFVAGGVGLALNAVLIDVFEASKIAFLLWLLVGVTLGVLHLYQRNPIDLSGEFKRIIISQFAIAVYLFVAAVVLFSSMLNNFFVGDDFTWFRWIEDCKRCDSLISTVTGYFTDSNGFFYRPGTKVYFMLMHLGFWLNQTMYHIVSLGLHFIVAVLTFLLAKKILRDSFLSILSALLFLILSGYLEVVFWISSTGFLFNAMFVLLSLLSFIAWKEKSNRMYFILCLLSITFGLLFHELGVVAPLLIIMYEYVITKDFVLTKLFKKPQYYLLFSPFIVYFPLRLFAQSHWFSGDYSYNLLKLPLNSIGNTIGYMFLSLFGPMSLPFYHNLRGFLRENILLGTLASFAIVAVFVVVSRWIAKRLTKEEQNVVMFGSLFFIIALLPFLGLGNITSRYSYLSSVGFVILFVFFLKKLYSYLESNGRYIASGSVITLICIFCFIHIIQLQKIHGDWYEAGEKSKKFLVSVEETYTEYWAKEEMKLYFANVPIRQGEAWVFPVGLSDALWFVFRNPKMQVYQVQTLEEAMKAIEYGSFYEKAFEFDSTGKVTEKKKQPPSVTKN